ncbi:1993_t:CDS:2, partial [Racocetra fulgida]
IKIYSKYVAEMGKHISVETIRNTLRRCGYKARVKSRKPAINENARLERLRFAKKHLKWTADNWRKVVFSDENKLESDYVNQTKKFGGGGIMVWSCIILRGVGEICRIKTHLNNKGYRIILAKDLFGTLLEHDLDLKDVILQHDGDPKHRATDTKNWINQRNINTLKWPPYSADLNPIENAWSEVKKCLEERLKELEQEQGSATKKEKLNKLWKMVEKE